MEIGEFLQLDEKTKFWPDLLNVIIHCISVKSPGYTIASSKFPQRMNKKRVKVMRKGGIHYLQPPYFASEGNKLPIKELT